MCVCVCVRRRGACKRLGNGAGSDASSAQHDTEHSLESANQPASERERASASRVPRAESQPSAMSQPSVECRMLRAGEESGPSVARLPTSLPLALPMEIARKQKVFAAAAALPALRLIINQKYFSFN